jgi:hypothetical protein
MINQLINELTFNPLDPFFIKKDIFSKKAKRLLPSGYDKFIEKFYRNWLLWTFNGELESTIVYPGIIDGIKNKKYEKYFSDFSIDDRNFIIDNFNKIFEDEAAHTEHFLNLLKTIYGDSIAESISDNSLKLASIAAEHKVDNGDFVELLFFYYIGECYLWSCFYQIYKKTTDPDLCKIFKKILVEEAQHNNHHYKLMKKIKDKIKIDLSLIIDTCRDYRHFGLEFVKREFIIADANTKKDHYILELIYNSQFHREFNQLAIKKYYQLIKILYPDLSIDEFTAMVNHNDGTWSSLPIAIDN